MLEVYKELDEGNITSSGFTLEQCEEKLNEKYFAVRNGMIEQLSGVEDTAREEFQVLLQRGCMKMNEYMCGRYFDIVRKASFYILDLIFESGNAALSASIETEGPFNESDLKRVTDLQYQRCRSTFGTALGLWSIPSDIHDKFESKFNDFKNVLVHNANLTNGIFQTHGNKRKALSDSGFHNKKNVESTRLPTPQTSSSSRRNSVVEEKKRAVLYRESMLTSISPSENTSTVHTDSRSSRKETKKKKMKVDPNEEASAVIESDANEEYHEDNLDPVARALAEARRKEQVRKMEMIEKLKSQSKVKKRKNQ